MSAYPLLPAPACAGLLPAPRLRREPLPTLACEPLFAIGRVLEIQNPDNPRRDSPRVLAKIVSDTLAMTHDYTRRVDTSTRRLFVLSIGEQQDSLILNADDLLQAVRRAEKQTVVHQFPALVPLAS